jgi:hypothetical protein
VIQKPFVACLVSLVNGEHLGSSRTTVLELIRSSVTPRASPILPPEAYRLLDAVHDERAMVNPLLAGSLGLHLRIVHA